jgi:hypothetical protein
MKVPNWVWASVLLGGGLVGAQGYHRAKAQDAAGDTSAATPAPQPAKTVFAMPTPQATAVQGNPRGEPKPTMCMAVPRKISAPPDSAPLSVRIYFEWVSLERRANVLVKDALSALPGQSFSRSPTHCESPRPVHAT